MPGLPQIEDTNRVVLHWVDSVRGNAVNVFHVRKDATSPAGIYNEIDAAWNRDMIGCVSQTARIDTISITPLDGNDATQTFDTGANVKWIGAGGGGPIPACAAIVSFQTGKRGPRYRGRIFLPFQAEGVQDGGVMSGLALTAAQAAWTTFNDDADFELVVASYKYADAEAVTSVVCRAVTGVQRRRQDRLQ